MVGSTAAGTNAPQEGPRLSARQQQERLAAAEESAWLDGVYYQSMLMNHKVRARVVVLAWLVCEGDRCVWACVSSRSPPKQTRPQAALFGRTHERMLRALYPPPPPPPPPAPQQQQQQKQQQGQDMKIWQRVGTFLEDAGGLMALRVQLLSARAAEPWMAPVPTPGARQVSMEGDAS